LTDPPVHLSGIIWARLVPREKNGKRQPTAKHRCHFCRPAITSAPNCATTSVFAPGKGSLVAANRCAVLTGGSHLPYLTQDRDPIALDSLLFFW